MSTAAKIETRAREGAFEAIVRSIGGAPGARTVVIEHAGERSSATVAIAGGYEPRVGDRVVALGSTDGAWVLGVVGGLRPIEPAVETSDGARASVDGDVLTVRDSRGELLFTHDAATGRSTVSAPNDLSIRSSGGDLTLEAAQTVRVRGRHVALEAGESQLSMSDAGADLRAPKLVGVLGEGRLSVKDATFAAERLQTVVERARHVLGVTEVRAQRIVERARDVFREADGVSQTRAGRIRVIAKAAYSVLADRATIKAETDVHIVGEKIHLA